MFKEFLRKIGLKRSERCTVVIVAAGQATRMQGEDKIRAELLGKSVIHRSVEVFQNLQSVDEIVIVTRKELMGYLRSYCAVQGFTKVSAVVEGGETRVRSVMNGLEHISKKEGIVAIHDGARPLVTPAVISAAIEKARKYHAAAPAVPVKDTLKIADNHLVQETPDRSKIFAVQTPQVFDYDLLAGALKHALDKQIPITDDCSAVEAIGMSVYLTEGSEENIKITTPIDLILAEAILKGREAQ